MGAPGHAAAPWTRPHVLLLAILVFAAILRFWDLGGPSLWIDEISSVSFARAPFGLLWSDWMVYETNPPFYYAALNLWVRAFGESEFAVRSLSAILGLAAIFAVYKFGKAFHSTSAGLLAALFCAVAAEQVGYSQETRGYMLGFLAATVTGLALVRLTDRWLSGPSTLKQSWPDYTLYAAACAIAVYTHTTLFLLPLVANLYMVWLWVFRTPRRMSDAIAWVGANAVVLAIASWWIFITAHQVSGGAETISWIQKPNLRDVVAVMSHIVATRGFEAANLAVAALFGGLIVWGAWGLPTERRAMAIVFGVAAPFILMAVSFVRPVFLERTIFWVQSIYITCLAIGVLTLPWPRFRVAAGILAALVLLADSIYWTRTTYREPWRDIAVIVQREGAPGDAMLTYSAAGAVNLAYYCRRIPCSNVPILAEATQRGKRGLGQFFTGPEIDSQNARGVIGQYHRIWVVSRTPDDPSVVLTGAAQEIAHDRLGDSTGRMRLSLWRPNAS